MLGLLPAARFRRPRSRIVALAVTGWLLSSGCSINFDRFRLGPDAGVANDGGMRVSDAAVADGAQPPNDAPTADAAPGDGSVVQPECLQIAAGRNHSCALRPGDGVYCWGRGTFGQLGDGDEESRENPDSRVVGLSSEEARIWAGGDVTCTQRTDGSVSCWGAGNRGQIPDVFEHQRQAEAVPGLTGIRELALGEAHGCAARATGTVACWGNNAGGHVLGISMPAGIYGLTPLVGPSETVAIAATVRHTCSAEMSGEVRCWGENQGTQLGDGSVNPSGRPITANRVTSPVSSLAAGGSFTCGRIPNGSGHQAECWGSALRGQLGDGTLGEVSPDPVVVELVGANVVELAAGVSHTCARTDEGQVYCWGSGEFGQLGSGDEPCPGADCASPTPVEADLSDVTQIAAGHDHTCAVVSCEQIFCWGQNDFGQLGNGTNEPSGSPVEVVGL